MHHRSEPRKSGTYPGCLALPNPLPFGLLHLALYPFNPLHPCSRMIIPVKAYPWNASLHSEGSLTTKLPSQASLFTSIAVDRIKLGNGCEDPWPLLLLNRGKRQFR